MKSISIEHFRTRFTFDLDDKEFSPSGTVTVYKATDHELHREVAIKIIQDDAALRRYPSLSDMTKLFKLEHGHLVRYFDFLRVEKSKSDPGFDVLVMDYISGGDISTLKGTQITEDNRRRVVEGLVGALGVLHQNGIFHGNLKPGNILFQDIGHLHVRLSDYGFIFTQEYDKTGTQYGIDSIKYLAPEQIEPDNFARRGRLKENVDFWSLGMITYELFTGKYAFGEPGTSSSDLMTKILHADLPKDIDHLPENYAELVKACLVRDASQRPKSIDALRRVLDGSRIWRDGKLRKKPRAREKARDIIPEVPPTPQDVKCGNCGKMNRPSAIICAYCDSAMAGPSFLKSFKRPGALAFWAMLFMTAVFIPLGFIYYEFHEFCIDGFACNFMDWLHAQEETFQNEDVQVVALILVGIFALGIVISLIFFLAWFARVNANLSALGSTGRNFHWTFILISFLIFNTGVGLLGKSPYLAAGIMLLALILPLLMFQEVWRGSNPNFLGAGTNWRRSKASFMIFSWWLTSLLLPVIVVIPFLPTPFEWLTYELWFILGVALTGTYWLLSMLLVIRINRRQISKFKAWARLGNE